MTEISSNSWIPGPVDIAVVMITLNEAHNLRRVLDNLKGWAAEVYILDSFSKDKTVDIALEYGVNISQRRFENFGDQWNFAINNLDIDATWTMKIDPDENLSDELKIDIARLILDKSIDGIEMDRRWWLMGKPLPISDRVLRGWRTGICAFTDAMVNEHPMVSGKVVLAAGVMEHFDSPNLNHWIEKQNRYSSQEAVAINLNKHLVVKPKLFGNKLERKMWLKSIFYHIPGRYIALFCYFWLLKGLWRTGKHGYDCAKLWTECFRWKELKAKEMGREGVYETTTVFGVGTADARVVQHEGGRQLVTSVAAPSDC